MTGFRGWFFTCCGSAAVLAGFAGPAASVPSRQQSIFPANGIYLVGSNGDAVDGFGEFTVTTNSLSNTPLPGTIVTIDFFDCMSDIRLAPQSFPGLVVQPGCVVAAQSDAQGVVAFRIKGGALNPGHGPGASYECAKIYADGVFFGNVTVAAFDQNGNLNGVNAADVSACVADILAVPPLGVGRSDFNFDDALSAADLSIMVSDALSGRGASNGGVLACP